ncbi:hypothetical protein ACLMJK_002972 [Lecanora helva]
MDDNLGMMDQMTSSACWAENTPYLTSLAWCMHIQCAESNISLSKFEAFWENQATGQSNAGQIGVPPKWSYAEALANVPSPPTIQLSPEATSLNDTSLVSPRVYQQQWNVLTSVQRETVLENTYGIAMLVTGFGTPIILTWLGYLPFFSTISRKLKPYLIWPSLVGNYQVRPLPFLLGNAPTVGQTLYVLMFLILNVVLTSVNFQSRQPNAWYSSTWREIMAYVLYRTGAFAYIIAPLIWLFGGRNNILLWATNWSRSMFLVLHRWVARIFTLQVLLHSIVSVILYKAEGTYDEEVKSSYWIWGIVATLCSVILTFGSGLYVRKFVYEFFLLQHIVLSAVLIVGCWYHAYDLYKFLGGYEDWMIAICAIWMFDRLGRVLRIVTAGPRRAKVRALNDEYIRIDISGIRWRSDPGKHVYVYFPTLHPLRPWENHPFSLLQTAQLQPTHTFTGSDSDSQTSIGRPVEHCDVEKNNAVQSAAKGLTRQTKPEIGLTLYARKSTGMTKNLASHNNLLTFVEGPYPNNSTRQVLCCDRLLLITGGIGITGTLPFANTHWNVKLAWSVKDSAQCLIKDLEGALSNIADKELKVGSRLNIEQLLKAEIDAGWERVGVVVCGPGALCDDTRAAVVAAGKLGKTEFEFEVEAYSW